ncbi:MAG: hypothetical protein CO094_11295 [Anaerolineae bacterium CG_4_9_14_3_um_filter_57_17]|nr:hypothetical protein [bacterium]NCT21655.1 hypothetical protein [bacterium]OIO86752.1 MAG: hypothetical protein AUK01_02320 [Anaerolineae bacterium CG2_30_57_67]PJB64944.1 MAG: hypothetical protein CO094_11295 [Anaerolineae bacterium CG_4_9_14_3_um_filter_57_17]
MNTQYPSSNEDDTPIFEPIATVDWQETLKNNAPALAFGAGNLLLLAGEYRVYAFAYDATGEIWKGIFAVMSSFLPFLLWEIAVQHKKANGIMRVISWVGIVISLTLGVVVGVAEFVTLPGQASVNAEFLLGMLAVSLSAHAVLFLAYYYSHPDMRAKRMMASAQARQEIASLNAEIAESVLTSWRERLQMERAIADEFGTENLRRVLDELEGKKHRQVNAQKRTWWKKPEAAPAAPIDAPAADVPAPQPIAFAAAPRPLVPGDRGIDLAAAASAGSNHNGHLPQNP